MAGDAVERPVVLAALVALIAILAIESAGVAATFRNPQPASAPTPSLINYVAQHVR
jgi:hypothetical protein